jgi:hypothetical protein
MSIKEAVNTGSVSLDEEHKVMPLPRLQAEYEQSTNSRGLIRRASVSTSMSLSTGRFFF